MTDRRRHVRARRPRRRRGSSTATASTTWPASLVVACREPRPGAAGRSACARSLRFLVPTRRASTGEIRNRRSTAGRWHGRRGSRTAGAAACGRSAPPRAVRRATGSARRARRCFDRGARQRSPWPRAMAFAALGAAEVLAVAPARRRRAALLSTPPSRSAVARDGHEPWPWPEPRLTYANAVLPEALIAAGDALDRPRRSSTTASRCSAGCSTARRVDGHLSVDPRRRRRARTTRAAVRPATDRGRRAGRRLRPGGRASPATTRGSTACASPPPGSSATTTPEPSMWDPGPAAASTVSQPTGPTSTRAPSRRWR